jgi:hypothetical protein
MRVFGDDRREQSDIGSDRKRFALHKKIFSVVDFC